MKIKLLLSLALVLGGNLFAREPDTNSLPQAGIHHWEYIQYPWNLPHCPTFLIGWPSGGNERSGELSRGLRMDILNIDQGPAFFKTNAITARLYRANGEIVEPTEEGKPLLNSPGYLSSMSGPGMEPSPQVLTYFPWGSNVLEESWIEVTITPERYWVEIPYGFDRNPAGPLASSNTKGPPGFFPVKSLSEHDHVVHWENVHYDLDPAQGDKLLLVQSNPLDPVSFVGLYNFSSIHSPNTGVRLLGEDGSRITGQYVHTQIGNSYSRRTDTFDLFDREADDSRCWGQIEVSVDGKIYRIVVPSSLYKHGHGHARKL